MTHFRNGWWVAALVALSACNPWSDTKGGAPAVLSAFVAGGNGGDGGTNSVEGVVSEDGTTWTIPGTTTCDAGASVANEFVVWVKLNKLIDGATIEQDPNTCVPAGVTRDTRTEGWFHVTQVSGTTPVGTAAEETEHWYSCYYPATSTTNEGASIVFYRTGATPDWDHVNPVNGEFDPIYPGSLKSGESFWDLACAPDDDGICTAPLPVRDDDVITYAITGIAKDKSGAELPLNLVFESRPDSGAVDLGVSAVTGDVDAASSVTLEWADGSCATAKEYQLQRESKDANGVVIKDANGEPVWTTIYTEPLGGTASFTDSTVAYGSKQDYRIVEVITGVQTTRDFTQVKATKTATILLIPAVPTFGDVTASSAVAKEWKG